MGYFILYYVFDIDIDIDIYLFCFIFIYRSFLCWTATVHFVKNFAYSVVLELNCDEATTGVAFHPIYASISRSFIILRNEVEAVRTS